jgi:predicted transcriptional regulator
VIDLVLDASLSGGDNLGHLEISMSTITVRVSDDISERLDLLARKLDRQTSIMAEQAIVDFVAREEWQIAEIEAGLAEADRGEFASDEEVAAVVMKYLKPVS